MWNSFTIEHTDCVYIIHDLNASSLRCVSLDGRSVSAQQGSAADHQFSPACRSSVCLLSSSSFGIACFVSVKLFMQPFINTLNKYKLHIMEEAVAVTVCQGVFS